MKLKSLNLTPVIGLFILGISITGLWMDKIYFKPKEHSIGQFLLPPENIHHFSLGYSELLADSLWIRVLQDFGYCEPRDSQKSRQEYEYAKSMGPDVNRRCNQGWVYQMLDRITNLSPKFQMAYRTGTTMLSVAVDDPIGAQKFFQKSFRAFPDDWVLWYRAGYHELYEIKDQEKAAEYLKKAGDLGAPGWVKMLAARLYTKEGQALLGYQVLQEYARAYPEAEKSPRYQELLRQIKANLSSTDVRLPAQKQENQ